MERGDLVMPAENEKTSTRKDAPKLRHVSAGPRALADMERAMGLDLPGHAWRLEGACTLSLEHVRMSLRNGKHRLVFYLLPPSAPKAEVRAEGFALAVEGSAGPSIRKFLARLAARLHDKTFAGVVAEVGADPDSFTEMVSPGSPEYVQVPCIGQPMGLLDAGWRNFYADQDFEVLLSVPSCSSDKTVNIEYADLECYYARPKRSFHKWTFLDWPQENTEEHVEKAGGGPKSRGSIVTELEERDMILGTGERADALVREVRELAEEGNYLVFTHLCTPIIMGEDFQGLAKRCEKEIGGKTVSWSQKDRDQNDNFGDHFRSVLRRPGFFDVQADASAVNLFHFPRLCREAEIIPFLDKIGLKTNASIFPNVDFQSIDLLPRAQWQIFCERTSYPTKIREILGETTRSVVTVRAPYGVEGTRECLRGVAAAAGKTEEFEAEWAGRMKTFQPRWDEMKKEAAGCGLAFVVSEATLPRLLSLRYGFGAPPAVMVREMGFDVHLVYYDIHGEPPELPAALEGVRLTVFRSPWELKKILGEGEFRAVFSDMFFDWRVSRAGKARFSSRDFEMGLEGAGRTFRRLLDICRLPFYRRYAAHLSPEKATP